MYEDVFEDHTVMSLTKHSVVHKIQQIVNIPISPSLHEANQMFPVLSSCPRPAISSQGPQAVILLD